MGSNALIQEWVFAGFGKLDSLNPIAICTKNLIFARRDISVD